MILTSGGIELDSGKCCSARLSRPAVSKPDQPGQTLAFSRRFCVVELSLANR
jgi:hypothetical protein